MRVEWRQFSYNTLYDLLRLAKKERFIGSNGFHLKYYRI